ncbi:MAG: SprT family zinc-dependent metalloprotease [Sulfuriferula sp.]
MPKRLVSIESRTLCLQNQLCAYQLKRSSARRTLALSVGKQGLIVHAPWRLSVTEIERFAHAKSTWIWEKLQHYATRTAHEWAWCDGMRLLYLGREIVLNVSSHSHQVVLIDDVLHVPTLSPEKIVAWYKHEAMRIFQLRLAGFSPQLDKLPSALRLTNARTRWGSCTSAGVIRLHWRLIQASMAEIDYVLAHELAHMTHMNHAARFWQRVAVLLPDYQQPHQQLRQAGHRYHDMCTELSSS